MRIARVSTPNRRENVLTASCRAAWLIAGCKIIWFIDKSWKESGFAERYSCLIDCCASATRRKCAEYQKSSTLKCRVGIVGVVKTTLTLICKASLYHRPEQEMGCANVVNIAKRIKIMEPMLCGQPLVPRTVPGIIFS